MKNVFNLLAHIQFIYPVKIFLRRRIADYFFAYHISDILEKASIFYNISGEHKLSTIKNESVVDKRQCMALSTVSRALETVEKSRPLGFNLLPQCMSFGRS